MIFTERQLKGRQGYALELVGILLMIAATFAGALAVASG